MRRVLLTGDEALGAKDASVGFDTARKSVDSHDVRRFVVPGTVFAPIGGRDFLPGVIEGTIRCEYLHCGDGMDGKGGRSRDLGVVSRVAV